MLLRAILICCICDIWVVRSLKFGDEGVEAQNRQSSSSFFPTQDEPDDRYSGSHGVQYVNPDSLIQYDSTQETSPKQQYYDNIPQQSGSENIPPFTSNGVNPYQNEIDYYPSNPSSIKTKRPKDQTSPFYQNYANSYQYPKKPYASGNPKYPNYYKPSKYPQSYPGQQAVNYSPQQFANYYYQGSNRPSINSGYPGFTSPSSPYPQASNQYQTSYPQQRPYQYYQQPQPNTNPYYPQNYANQFGNYRPTRPSTGQSGLGGLSGGVSNLLNNIRGTSVGGQFSKAINDISENDELNCVPKLLCQMIGNPRRQSQLPGFMNIPAISALISALPSGNPLMNFGRAALLGLSGGESGCDAAFPRCPKNEEEVLYYLNNHRGGFFRFFNGGAGFGEDYSQQGQSSQYQQGQYNQQQNIQQNNPQYTGGESNQGLNLLALQALAGAINQGNGINLSQLGNLGGLASLGNLGGLTSLFSGTTQRPPTNFPSYASNTQNYASDAQQSSPSSTNSFTDIVSNLLTGIVGNRFSRSSSKKISKRSIDNIRPKEVEIQPRIINLKEDIVAETKFFPDSQQTLVRAPKYINQSPSVQQELEKPLKFPKQDDAYKEIPVKSSLAFPEENISFAQLKKEHRTAVTTLAFPQNFPQEDTFKVQHNIKSIISPSDVAKRLTEIFDDRTGTGNLKFDSDEFHKDLYKQKQIEQIDQLKQLSNLMTAIRLARILTGNNQKPQNSNQNAQYYQNQNYNQNYNQNRPIYQASQQAQQNYSPNRYSASNYNTQQKPSNSNSHLVYVTGNTGQIEYVLDEKTGQKNRY